MGTSVPHLDQCKANSDNLAKMHFIFRDIDIGFNNFLEDNGKGRNGKVL